MTTRAAKHMLVTVFLGHASVLCIKRGSGILQISLRYMTQLDLLLVLPNKGIPITTCINQTYPSVRF